MKRNKLIKFDRLFFKSFSKHYFLGIDEVGRGSLAGPVIACAFSWKEEVSSVLKKEEKKSLSKLNDSKQLTSLERNEIYPYLLKYGNFGLGYATVLEIEKLNILNATFLAMKRAFDNFTLKINSGEKDFYALIDGNKFNPFINCRQSSIVDGDTKSALIAGASVIAKVYRDMLMSKISNLKGFQKYSWSKNMGYGTEFHRKTIKQHGLSPLHRKLFVRKIFSCEGNLTTAVKD